ncbi:hypothetical protein DNTS_018586 [Danionella cerebrum]|uniref:ELMO domain-containing protein n=1 Tax=Danionella cerebrum TaxID=2873325 RepID=A0A553Q9J9_9TELE|nr:hypothetical protein DNTS_018586 [Danionella translucida]
MTGGIRAISSQPLLVQSIRPCEDADAEPEPVERSSEEEPGEREDDVRPRAPPSISVTDVSPAAHAMSPPLTDMVKVAIEWPGANPQLMEIDQKKPLSSFVREVCDGWSLSGSEQFALRYADGPQLYITEQVPPSLPHSLRGFVALSVSPPPSLFQNRGEIKNGSILRLAISPSRAARQLLERVQCACVEARVEALKELAKLSSDAAFAREFINMDGLESLARVVEGGTHFGEMLAFTLTAFLELMDHGIVSWDMISISFIKQIAGYVNQPLVEASVLQRSLAVLESIVLNIHTPSLNQRVCEEISVSQLIAHLQESNQEIQTYTVALINALFLKTPEERRQDMASSLAQRHLRSIILNHIIRGARPIKPELAHQLYVLQVLSFNLLEERMMTRMDPSDQTQAQLVVDLRRLALDGDSDGERRKPVCARDYKILGFSNPGNPAVDLAQTPPGMLALDNMLYLAKVHQDTYLRLLADSSAREEKHECPFARCSIELTRMLCEILQVGELPNEGCNDFHPMFFTHENCWEEFYCISIQLLYRTWREMRATAEDFSKVMSVVREQISRALLMKPLTLDQLKMKFSSLGYSEILRLRQSERMSQDDCCSAPIIELRERIQPEILELIKQQRLNRLCDGGCFRKLGNRRRQEKFWFCRLSLNHKVLHYGDVDESPQGEVPFEMLTDKISVSDMKALLTGKDCPHMKEKSALKQNKDVLELAFSLLYDPDESLNFVAPNKYEFSIWTDGLSVLIGKELCSDLTRSDLETLMNMEMKLRLLDLENISIPEAPPPVPKEPSSMCLWLSGGLLLVLLTHSSWGFNLDSTSVLIREGQPGSFFGLSVALHQQIHPEPQSWVLVGAPQARGVGPLEPIRTGALYRCPLTTEDCQRVDLDNNLSKGRESKENQGLGSIVRSQGVGGKVVTCAPRYELRAHVNHSFETRDPVGRCFVLSEELRELDDLEGGDWKLCEGRLLGHDAFGSCQQGLDASFSPDRKHLLLGAPGTHNWKGLLFMASTAEDTLIYKSLDASQSSFQDLAHYSYLGFSVDSAKALIGRTELTVLSGAPRAGHRGAVVFLRRDGMYRLIPEHILWGEELASSFGYCLATMDLNADGWTDLVVGAPNFFDRPAEIGGAVYVFLNPAGHWERTRPLRLNGTIDSLFGTAVGSAGDLDRDGYHDIAVGAPFDGDGKVFIFRGSASGIDTKPSQVLDGLNAGVKLFGFSLSGGLDLDGNHYPDLAVGSLSDAVVLYRSRPVVHVVREISIEPQYIDLSQNNCPEQDAVWSEHIPLIFTVVHMVPLFPALMLSNKVSKSLWLRSSRERCLLNILLLKLQLLKLSTRNLIREDLSSFNHRWFLMSPGSRDVAQRLFLSYGDFSSETFVLCDTFLRPDSRNCLRINAVDSSAIMEVTACYTYTAHPDSYSPHITLAIHFEAEVERRKSFLPHRVRFLGRETSEPEYTLSAQVELKGQRRPECVSAKFHLQENIRDKLRPVTLAITHTIRRTRHLHHHNQTPHHPERPLEELSPVLSPSPSNTLYSEVNFVREGCGEDKICQSNLQLTYQFGSRAPISNTFTLLPQDAAGVPVFSLSGQRSLVLELTVTNSPSDPENPQEDGDDAHGAQITLMLPNTLSYSGVTSSQVLCEANQNGSLAVCDLGNPLKRDAVVTFWLTLSTANIRVDTTSLSIQLALTTISEQPSLAPVSALVRVVIELPLLISGVARPHQLFFSGFVTGESAMKNIQDIGSPVDFEITVSNTGPSLQSYGSLSLTVQWPIELLNRKWLLYLSSVQRDDLQEAQCEPKYAINPLALTQRGQSQSSRRVRSHQEPEAADADPADDMANTAATISRRTHVLDCALGSVRCVLLECPLQAISGSVRFRFRANLWNSTFLEEFPLVRALELKIRANLTVRTSIRNLLLRNTDAQLSVKVYPEESVSSVYSIPWWVFLVAALLGLVLLALLVCALWKCGFFRRSERKSRFSPQTQREYSPNDPTDSTDCYQRNITCRPQLKPAPCSGALCRFGEGSSDQICCVTHFSLSSLLYHLERCDVVWHSADGPRLLAAPQKHWRGTCADRQTLRIKGAACRDLSVSLSCSSFEFEERLK